MVEENKLFEKVLFIVITHTHACEQCVQARTDSSSI